MHKLEQQQDGAIVRVQALSEWEMLDYQLSSEEKGKIRRQNEHELLLE